MEENYSAEPLPPGIMPSFPPKYPFKWQQKIMPEPHPSHLRSMGLPTEFSTYQRNVNNKTKNPGHGGYYYNHEYNPDAGEYCPGYNDGDNPEEYFQTDESGMLVEHEYCENEEPYSAYNEQGSYDEHSQVKQQYPSNNQHQYGGHCRTSNGVYGNDLPSYLKNSDEYAAYEQEEDCVDEEAEWKKLHNHKRGMWKIIGTSLFYIIRMIHIFFASS